MAVLDPEKYTLLEEIIIRNVFWFFAFPPWIWFFFFWVFWWYNSIRNIFYFQVKSNEYSSMMNVLYDVSMCSVITKDRLEIIDCSFNNRSAPVSSLYCVRNIVFCTRLVHTSRGFSPPPRVRSVPKGH